VVCCDASTSMCVNECDALFGCLACMCVREPTDGRMGADVCCVVCVGGRKCPSVRPSVRPGVCVRV